MSINMQIINGYWFSGFLKNLIRLNLNILKVLYIKLMCKYIVPTAISQTLE